MVEKVDGITHLSFFLVTSQTHISFYKYYLHFFKKYNLFIPLFYNFIENGYTDKTNTERSIYL